MAWKLRVAFREAKSATTARLLDLPNSLDSGDSVNSDELARWRAVCYILWYENRELYALAWNSRKAPFQIDSPFRLGRKSPKQLEGLFAKGCCRDLIHAAILVLATDYSRFKRPARVDLDDCLMRIRNSRKAVRVLLRTLKDHGNLDEMENLERFAELPALIDDFVGMANRNVAWLEELGELEGREHIYRHRALMAMCDHLKSCGVHRIPWTVIADLITESGRETNPESLRAQYNRSKAF